MLNKKVHFYFQILKMRQNATMLVVGDLLCKRQKEDALKTLTSWEYI